MHRWKPPRVRCRRLRTSTTDQKRPPGDLRATNRQDSIDVAVVAGPSISRIKKYFFRPPASVPLISLDHERTERYSHNCMTRLGVPRGIRAGGPRLRASNRKTPDAQTPISNLPGPISNLQSASRRDPQSPMSNARPGLYLAASSDCLDAAPLPRRASWSRS